MDKVQCREMIISTIKKRGAGVEGDPVRIITEVYEKDGMLVAEHDPCPYAFNANDMLSFVKWVQKMEYDAERLDEACIYQWRDFGGNSFLQDIQK